MTQIASEAYVGMQGRNEYFAIGNADHPGFIDGRDGSDVIAGFDASDTLFGGLGSDLILAGGGNDAVYGDQSWNDETTNVNTNAAAAADALFGEAGNDTIYGGGGNNFLNGGADDDLIQGGSGNELLEGSDGNDAVHGGDGSDTLYGGSATQNIAAAFLSANIGTFTTTFFGNDDTPRTLTINTSDYASQGRALTGTGNDVLDGGAGNDVIDGQDGADKMTGGEGNDRFYVDNAADVVKEAVGEGSDYVLTSVSYGLKANVEVEKLSTTSTGGSTAISLTGNEFGQQILGNQAGNKLVALGGNDTVYGYGGNDAIYGGDGKDVLVGGLGNDQFQFDTALGSANIDTITDFHNVSGDNDTIRLENAIFTKLTTTGALSTANFASNATGTATDANDYVVYNTSVGALFYDADGNGAGRAIQFATLTDHPTLTAVDFLIV